MRRSLPQCVADEAMEVYASVTSRQRLCATSFPFSLAQLHHLMHLITISTSLNTPCYPTSAPGVVLVALSRCHRSHHTTSSE